MSRPTHPATDRTIVVVTGAAPLPPLAVTTIPDHAFVLAADGGLDHALAAGLSPDVLVGDLDSVSDSAKQWAVSHAEVVEFPADKSVTDTELALSVAVERAPARLIMIAGTGDRIDHTIAAIGSLGSSITASVPTIEGWWGEQRLFIVRPGRPAQFDAAPGTTFSVLALHGAASDVTITGARWPLTDALVRPVSGLGVSNEVATSPTVVSIGSGVLTVVVQPEALGASVPDPTNPSTNP